MRQDGERIEQVVTHHPQRITNCGQVVNAVPFVEQRQIVQQLLARASGKRERQMFQAALERGARRHAVFVDGWNPLFKCTSSSEIAAGVMPEMRDAWPMVSGRWRLSFCCTSTDSPFTPR